MNYSGWSKLLVFIGIFIFIVNMALAWKTMFSASDAINRPLIEAGNQHSATAQALKMVERVRPELSVFLSRFMEAEVQLKIISNRQGTMVVAMAAAFGLIAVGFALFVMGIESQYSLTANLEGGSEFSLASASPGLACFLLATVVVCYTLSRDTKLEFGSFEITPAGAQTNAAPQGFDQSFVAPDAVSAELLENMEKFETLVHRNKSVDVDSRESATETESEGRDQSND